MFNRDRLMNVLIHYKQDFAEKQWPEEKYKWEAVKNFQDNWDVNSRDFAGMLARSLAKTANLLASVKISPQKYCRIMPKLRRKKFGACLLTSSTRTSKSIHALRILS